MIRIEFQDKNGTWRLVTQCLNNPQRILSSMQSAAEQHPGTRIRAVTSDGRLVDMMLN